MRLRTDDRGVTVQIGTVLLFGVLIVLLSVYQASVVPQQNEEVEFNHNQQVQGDLQDLRDELRRTATTGSGATASVALGTRYPVRAFFVNPPPPSGTLRTTASANLTIRNATADGEIGDYWTGDRQNFSTRGLAYQPDYSEYRNPPTTVYRNGVLYNRFDGANITIGGQQLVRGNRISLVALDGRLSESTSETASVNVRPVSAATRSVAVRNGSENENVSIVVPTNRSATEWEELLADEMNENENDDRYVLAVEDVADRDAVRVVLEPATYELELAKVGVGREVTDTDAHYVTDVRGDNTSVAAGSTRKLVAEVRDRFNNPVSDARVNLSLVDNDLPDRLRYLGESGQRLTNVRTNSEGQVTVWYEVDSFNGSNEKAKVRASIAEAPPNAANESFAEGEPENLTFRLNVYSVGSGDGPGPPDDPGDGNDSEPEPTVDFRVDDLSHVNQNQVEFVTSYHATNVNESFERVSVQYANVDQPDATGTNSSTATRGNLQYRLEYGTSNEWNVTAQVIYENDAGAEYVAASKSITDVADALNPNSNDDLSQSGSPSVSSYTVTDKTNSSRGPWYRIDYAIATSGNFRTVQGAAIGLVHGDAVTATAGNPNGRFDLEPGYNEGDQFRIKLLIYDDDGAVVAVRAVTDEADGS